MAAMTVDLRADLPLLPTKLVAPGVRPHPVQRSRLLERLAAATEVPVTLIAAPAGFGKTTLLAQWVGRLRPAPHGWVSLGAGDVAVARFWAYVLAALRAAWPPLTTHAQAGSPLPTAVPAQLVVDLAQLDRYVVLVPRRLLSRRERSAQRRAVRSATKRARDALDSTAYVGRRGIWNKRSDGHRLRPSRALMSWTSRARSWFNKSGNRSSIYQSTAARASWQLPTSWRTRTWIASSASEWTCY